MATYRYRQRFRLHPGIWVAVALGLLASSAGAILLWWPTQGRAIAPSLGGSGADGRLHRNAEAGYEVRVPTDWRVTESGSVTRLSDPDGSTVVTIGVGSDGSLEDASEALVASVRASYADVQLSGTEPEPIFGNRSLVAGGVATNERGERVRFLAIAIAGGGENYAMTAFTPGDADPSEVLPELAGIVHSFRPPTS